MPPRKRASSSNAKTDGQKPSRSKKSKSHSTMITDGETLEVFYFNLWGQEVNEDLMQYIFDYVPVYPDMLRMRETNRFWKKSLEKIFFPKVRVLDLLTRGKDKIEVIRNNKITILANYFPNITKLRVCQPGWNLFFKQPNKIEIFEFYDLECVVVATSWPDFLEELMNSHRSNKHTSCLKIVNVYGGAESSFYAYSNRSINNYFNGTLKKGQSPMHSLEAINLSYYANNVAKSVNKLNLSKPISDYDNVVEFWDKMVFEENINWTLLHPFSIVEPLNNSDLFDLIIEYAKAQDIPIVVDYQSINQIAASDLVFDEFYKRFVINPDLDEHLRYKFDKIMLDQVFQSGNSLLLDQIIDNKDIPILIEGAKNPLIALINSSKMSLFKKALKREPTLLNLGNSTGAIEGHLKDMNLISCVLRSNHYTHVSKHFYETIKFLIEMGVDINFTNERGSIVSLISENQHELLSLFEDIQLDTLEKKNSLGFDTVEQCLRKLHRYSNGGKQFLLFFEKIYKKHGKELRDYVISDGGNILHALTSAPNEVFEYCLKELKIDITQKNTKGKPALFNVAPSWGREMLRLVKDDLDERDTNGRTLLSTVIVNSKNDSCTDIGEALVDMGCDLEYALSQAEFRFNLVGSEAVLESKKGEAIFNGAKLLLVDALNKNTNFLGTICKKENILRKCLENEVDISCSNLGEFVLTPIYALLITGRNCSELTDLGIITRKHYFMHDFTRSSGKYTDEKEGDINSAGLASILGMKNVIKYLTNNRMDNLLDEKSSITQLNSWMLAIKYGHFDLAREIITHFGKSLQDFESIINELAASNFQYHILGDTLKIKLKENKLEGNDISLLSGYIFNFTEFGQFSEMEPFIEDLLDQAEILEQKCILQTVKRDDSEWTQFIERYENNDTHKLEIIRDMYNRIHEGVTYHLSCLEVCVLRGYPIKKIETKLTTEKSILKFLLRKEKTTGKPFIHILCDASLLIYLNVEKRTLHSYKHSIVIALLSKLSAASKKQVLNSLDAGNETPIFGVIRSEMKSLVKSLAPNTIMSVRNSKGKTCLDISKSTEINNILIQYADKKSLAAKRQSDEEQEKSRKKRK